MRLPSWYGDEPSMFGIFYFMGTKLNLTGKRFGKLVAVRIAGKNKQGLYRWLCECDCGNEHIVKVSTLMEGKCNSCGCLIVESITKIATKHNGCNTLEYNSWENMKARCYNTKSIQYHDYGGRGIKMCDRWMHSFSNFLFDMGAKPTPNHSLDRIDVNGDYEPLNCRWSTRKEQSRNKRNNRYLEYNSIRMVITDWGKFIGVHPMVIHHHLKTKSFYNLIEYYKIKYNLQWEKL